MHPITCNEPFFNTLKKKHITQYQLINQYHVSAGQLSRMRSNTHISTHIIDMLCNILDCQVDEILCFYKSN
ncbi:helix-turn-helix domain-containing protein [Mediterraneibacter faecis]|uniref:helix-turn-helix domain-containing protein n=1 Tax=Mediterraneibacter faecis TaxID=592978 RepID=UPI0032643233